VPAPRVVDTTEVLQALEPLSNAKN